MVPGDCIPEFIEIARQVATEVMPQALVAVTQRFPPEVPEVSTILSVPCPPVIIYPEGVDHVYETAPGTGVTE